MYKVDFSYRFKNVFVCFLITVYKCVFSILRCHNVYSLATKEVYCRRDQSIHLLDGLFHCLLMLNFNFMSMYFLKHQLDTHLIIDPKTLYKIFNDQLTD